MMKLKLTKTTLLLFFIGVLVLGMCCGIVVEGMKNNDDQNDDQNDDKRNEKSHEIHKPDGDRLMRQWMDKNIYDIEQKAKWTENHLYQDESKPEPDYKMGAPVETSAMHGAATHAATQGAASHGAATHAASLTANPKGIPKNQIPKGDEDLYILKSQIVPPVCPACPTTSECPREKPCPACPPCARCPEPAFECKKVPNYRSSNTQYLPRPMLTDFSGF